jgi:hypothetical protein
MRLDGTSLKDAATQCEMSRTTVIAAVKAYEAGGWNTVDVDRGGRPVGSGRMLSVEQAREVQRLIRDRTPDELKMVCALWTRQTPVIRVNNQRHGLSGISTVTNKGQMCWKVHRRAAHGLARSGRWPHASPGPGIPARHGWVIRRPHRRLCRRSTRPAACGNWHTPARPRWCCQAPWWRPRQPPAARPTEWALAHWLSSRCAGTRPSRTCGWGRRPGGKHGSG